MLVAEKHYLEDYAYEVSANSLNKEIKTVEGPKYKTQPKARKKNKVMPIVMVLIGFALSSIAVARYVVIAQNHSDILKLEKELEEEYKREQQLKLELNYCGDLKRIEEYAKNNLDMDYPDEDQVLYVQLPQQDLEQAEEGTEKDTRDESVEIAQEDQSRKTLWDKIISLLD